MRGLETIAVSCPLHGDSNPCVTPELLSVSCSPALCDSRRDPVPNTVKPSVFPVGPAQPCRRRSGRPL
jgi:hypothetical protein